MSSFGMVQFCWDGSISIIIFYLVRKQSKENNQKMNVDHDSGCIQSESGCGVNSDGWCFFLDPDSEGNTWCIMCGNAGGANKPAAKPTEPIEQYPCASGNFCQMKGVPLGFHKCKACKQPMHGTLCAGLDHEDGHMWCLICRKPAGLIDPIKS